MRQLYVCSAPKPDTNGEMHRHLIGILSQSDDGKYQFEYKLDDSPENMSLKLAIFPDLNRVYNNLETRLLLEDYLPSENDTAYIRQILRDSGQSEYDEWQWLLTFESDDPETSTVLYEELPDDIVLHCDLDNSDTTEEKSDESEVNNMGIDWEDMLGEDDDLLDAYDSLVYDAGEALYSTALYDEDEDDNEDPNSDSKQQTVNTNNLKQTPKTAEKSNPSVEETFANLDNDADFNDSINALIAMSELSKDDLPF